MELKFWVQLPITALLFIFFMILSSLVGLPLIGAGLISLFNETQVTLIRKTGLFISGLVFILSVVVWVLFDVGFTGYQFVEEGPWLTPLNSRIILGVDGISILFVVLTAFLTPVCLLSSWEFSSPTRQTKASFKI